ncbi:hypothetical protein I2F62_01240 [Acinetobacter sp. MD2(2019)]|nr:hypothetical protein [Acinetobacter sp. MD2(2019)]
MNINLTILAQILKIIGCLCSIWVYIDASGHKIGKTPQGGFFNLAAGWWGTLSLLIWFITFPLYLSKRKKLMGLAKKHPVESKARMLKISIFIFISGLFIFL